MLTPLPPERLADILRDYDWECVFGESDSTSSCTALPFTRADVAELYLATDGEPDGAEWECAGRLNDGRYFTANGGCDYTGWG